MNSNATSQVARTVRGCEVIPLGTLDHTTQEAYGWLVFITVISLITCPITTGLNTLIMIAVKTKHRVKTKSNIALASLSSTDAVMGVIGQPLFISWVIAELQGNTFSTYLWYFMVFSVVVNCRTEKLQKNVWKFPLPR